MRRSIGVGLAFAVGLAAVVAPIWTSIYLARRQSLNSEKSRVLTYAHDVMRRAYETRDQSTRALNELSQDGVPACSPQEMDLMRQLDVSSSYIQAVARISGDSLTCTSLGTTQPIPIGPPTLVTEYGVTERFNVLLPMARSYPLTVISKDGIAVLLDPALLVDTPTEGPDISIALYPPSQPDHGVLAQRGSIFRSKWFQPIPKGTETSFIDEGYIVTVVRSPGNDLAVVVAAPQLYVNRHVLDFAIAFVPIGLLCGIGLVWAVIYISRIRLSLPAVLRAAARRKEFFVEYQPIVELASQRWVGAEALVRWKSNGKIIRPDLFIPAAEENGVITHITECVAALVAADLPRLMKLDPKFQVAINLSAADLRSPRTIDVLDQLIRSSGAQASNLEIEATERGFLQGAEATDLLARIRAMGIGVAIDDFGTGYSGLACLQTLGLDTMKIDKAFVETIGTDGATSQVVPHIIEMAHSLKLEMVAEGVETEAQALFLKSRGVHYAQGWLFAKAMPIHSLCEALQTQKTAKRES